MTTAGPADDDDLELELEPIDPEILQHERARGERKTDEAVASIDVKELYKTPERREFELDWKKVRSLRFTTRRLLMLTAVMAFGLALYQNLGGCMSLFVGACLAIGVGWFAVYRIEQREEAERERLRREFDASRKASPAASTVTPWIEEPEPDPPPFRFAFSLREVFIAMTIAAVVLGMLRFIGPQYLTMTLGALALIGLAVQTLGWLDPPPTVVLGWWMLLVLYLALGLLTAFFPKLMGDRRPPSGASAAAVYSLC